MTEQREILHLTTADSDSLITERKEVEEVLAKYDQLGGDDQLSWALSKCNTALSRCAVLSNPAQDSRWRILKAIALRFRFERDLHDPDIREAIDILEAIMPSFDPSSSPCGLALYSLGRIFEALYDCHGSEHFLRRSHSCYRQALLKVAALKGVHLRLRVADQIPVHLGRAVNELFLLTREGEYLSEAIELIFGVVQRLDKLDPFRPYALASLCCAYRCRYSCGDPSDKLDLLKSERYGREALQLVPTHRYRRHFLHQLSVTCMLWDRADHTQESISLSEAAVRLLPKNHSVLAIDKKTLQALAVAYVAMFEAEARLSDLDNGLKYQELLVACTQPPDPMYLNYLSFFYKLRFEMTGRWMDIDNAVTAGKSALTCSHPNQAAMDYALMHVGDAYASRFIYGSDDEDFRMAELSLAEAVRRCQSNQVTRPLLAQCFRSLAGIYNAQFELDSRPEHLDGAVKHMGEAVALTELIPNRDRASFLSELGWYLSRRFEVGARTEDLEEAISCHLRAFQSASPTTHVRHLIRGRYGHAIRQRFRLSRQCQDWKTSVEALKDAYGCALAVRSAKQSWYLSELGMTSTARYNAFRHTEDLDAALKFYADAASVPEGYPGDRFHAAVFGARLAWENGRLDQATSAFSEAVSLLPRIAWLGLNVSKRHSKLAQASCPVTCNAATCAIMFGNLDLAVELLEAGRSVLWRSVLELRTDLAELQTASPELARQLMDVGQALELDDMSARDVTDKHSEEHAQCRRRTAERWDHLIESVRNLKGFKSFLKPLPFSVLRRAGECGPVIFLNVSEYGSHALIVGTSRPVQCIPLLGLGYETVKRLAWDFSQAMHGAKHAQGCLLFQCVLQNVVRSLWTGGLSEVASALRSTQDPADAPLLHVWWIPMGFLSLLPVHCAGPYQDGQKGIPDLFISSYTTTLAALLAARTRQSSSPRMLAIGQSDTPGYPALPCAALEIQVPKSTPCFRDSFALLRGAEATVTAVTQALPEYNWLHASCHGHWDGERPLESAFHLKDGPLKLFNVSQMRLKDAEFAFLSACHTARYTAVLPDESMNIASGLQIAGFRGLLATAWSMADRDGLFLAKRFYHWLTIEGQVANAEMAAKALHLAVNDLRDSGVPLFRWAPFVHLGI